ncbi:MAG: sugar phosphate isomerase/epimerase [Candidatus Solibacter sp.]|nr:sugar phosphate isomerase/epimerase [Candidatus Solibacter sp.]
MKLGLNTLLFTAGFDESHLPLLDKVKQWGFDGIEIARFSFDGFPARAIGQKVRDAGLECTFCSALTGDLSLISEDASVRRRASDFIRQGVETAAEIGSPVFVGPYCAPVGLLVGRRKNEDEWKRAVEELRALASHFEACKVALANEPLNRFETYFLNTAAEAVKLCDEVGSPWHGILFDTFHANIEEKNGGDALRSLGSRVKHIHACENDRGAPGTGNVGWADVFAAAKETGFDGWMVIESFGSNIPEIAAAACIWRDVAASPEALATEGLAFLKKNTQAIN